MTERIDLTAQNGNDALIYAWRELESIDVRPSIELCERVLGLQGVGWRESWRRECTRANCSDQ